MSSSFDKELILLAFKLILCVCVDGCLFSSVLGSLVLGFSIEVFFTISLFLFILIYSSIDTIFLLVVIGLLLICVLVIGLLLIGVLVIVEPELLVIETLLVFVISVFAGVIIFLDK